MGVAHVGLVHRDPCECKVKGFRAVSSIERNVSKRRHLQGVRHLPNATFSKSFNCTIGIARIENGGIGSSIPTTILNPKSFHVTINPKL